MPAEALRHPILKPGQCSRPTATAIRNPTARRQIPANCHMAAPQLAGDPPHTPTPTPSAAASLRPHPAFASPPSAVTPPREAGCAQSSIINPPLSEGVQFSMSLRPQFYPSPDIATTGAVTPARRTACLRAGLPASRNRPSEPSVSNHRPAPMAALHLTPQRHRLPPLAQRSGLHPRPSLGQALGPQARQTVRPNRVSHRTDGSFASCCSPPASRRRSYTRLQAGVGIPGEDLHLPDQLRSQAHGPGATAPGSEREVGGAATWFFGPPSPALAGGGRGSIPAGERGSIPAGERINRSR